MVQHPVQLPRRRQPRVLGPDQRGRAGALRGVRWGPERLREQRARGGRRRPPRRRRDDLRVALLVPPRRAAVEHLQPVPRHPERAPVEPEQIVLERERLAPDAARVLRGVEHGKPRRVRRRPAVVGRGGLCLRGQGRVGALGAPLGHERVPRGREAGPRQGRGAASDVREPPEEPGRRPRRAQTQQGRAAAGGGRVGGRPHDDDGRARAQGDPVEELWRGERPLRGFRFRRRARAEGEALERRGGRARAVEVQVGDGDELGGAHAAQGEAGDDAFV
jgi:hypothetical protein